MAMNLRADPIPQRRLIFIVGGAIVFCLVSWPTSQCNLRRLDIAKSQFVKETPRRFSEFSQTSSEPTKKASFLSENKGLESSLFRIQVQEAPSITKFNLGGPGGNETYRMYLQKYGEQGSIQSWQKWLSGVNASHRPKGDVLKLLLMTRNEWPLLREWVYYHGAMLGFQNLHIFDGSTDPRCIQFLKEARKQYGLNVVFTQTDLNGLSALITDAAKKLAPDADFFAKVGEL